MGLIVLIDDEEFVSRTLARVLRRTGAEVVTFVDPHEALEFIETDAPSLVVCDFHMPKMSGLEVLERLPRRVPFVLMTGDAVADGVDDDRIAAVVGKPIRSSALLEILSPYL